MIAHAVAKHLLLAEMRASARVWLAASRMPTVHPARAGRLRADAFLTAEMAQRIADGEATDDEVLAVMEAATEGLREYERDTRADIAAFYRDCGGRR